ncbi:MAG: aminotransferase class I/II-fold pyridoxal phosphate-dependent enzyme [Saprospiraceae bacterium]|nr:aminotransferase class I/II-fold pyridoxal phosphate-dependent enzyme [Saprospiraceae bacterium]
MREQIVALEELGQMLSPDSVERSNDIQEISKFCSKFIDDLEHEKAYHQPKPLKELLNYDPAKTESILEILSELKSDMMSNGLNPASGGHLGYIPGGGIHMGALGDYLAAVSNQYAGISFGGPGAVKIENELIRWMNSLIGYPSTSLGNLASGGSTANLIAFVTAREAREIHSREYEKQCIYLTHQVHHCVHKAIRICGLKEAQTRFIDVDSQFRMDVNTLELQIQKDIKEGLTPFMIVASIGTTDTGSVDPVNDIATIAEKYKIWFHIDAAYGGFFILSQIQNEDGTFVKNLFKGVERSDSFVIDPHKGLFLSYGLGAVLIKDVASMYKAHYYKAAYMQDTLNSQDELSPADLSVELTKHFRGMRLWLPLKHYGIHPFQSLLDEKILLCRYFYAEIQKLGFTVGPYPELSVCIYRYVPQDGNANYFNEKLLQEVLRIGKIFISSTSIDGVFWLRLAVLSFRTHLKEIDQLLVILNEAKTKALTDTLTKDNN